MTAAMPMDDRPGMRMLWRNPQPAFEMVVIDDEIVITRDKAVFGLDAQGRERWQRSFERQPSDLTRCGAGVAFAMSSRWASTQIAALDREGNEAWRYDRQWGLLSSGITGDERGLFLYGQDDGAVADNHWVGLDPTTGSVSFDVKPVVDAPLDIAGPWLLATIDGSEGGVMRLDRRAANPTKLTSVSYIGRGANDRWMVVVEGHDENPGDALAIELATGREVWRARGGMIVEIPFCGDRVAWVEGSKSDGHPVVYGLASGRQLWAGAPLPSILGLSVYDCVLAPRALVCIADESIVYYTFDQPAPIFTRTAPGNRPDFAIWGDRLLESDEAGLTCWEIL